MCARNRRLLVHLLSPFCVCLVDYSIGLIAKSKLVNCLKAPAHCFLQWFSLPLCFSETLPRPRPPPGVPFSKFVSRLHYNCFCFLLFFLSLFQPNVGFPDMDFHGVRIPSELSSLLLWILSPCTTLLSLKKLKNQHSTDIIKRERKGTRASDQLTSSSLERSTLAETAALEHWISLASSELQYISTIIHSAAGLQVLTRALQSVKLIWSSETAAIFRFVQCSISCCNEAATRSCCCCNNVLNNQGASGVPVVSGRKAWASSHDRRRVSHSSKWPPLERHAHFSSPTMHAYTLHLQLSERETEKWWFLLWWFLCRCEEAVE